LELISNEKSGDKTEFTDTVSKSAEMQRTTNKLSVQEQVLIQPSNTRELQIDQTEIIAEQDQPTQESSVKPTELDHVTDEVSAVDISVVNATVSASVEEIEEVSFAKEEGVLLQEEEIAGEMPKVELEKIEAEDEKHTEEEVKHYLHCLRIKETILLGSTRFM
jgi:hypothetical protein